MPREVGDSGEAVSRPRNEKVPGDPKITGHFHGAGGSRTRVRE
jgi:hypothetical protein